MGAHLCTADCASGGPLFCKNWHATKYFFDLVGSVLKKYATVVKRYKLLK